MARRKSSRKHRRSRKHRNAAPHRRASRRRSRRAFHMNAPAIWKDLMTAVVAGGAGYLASRKGSDMIEKYLPSFIPMKDIAAPAAASILLIMLSEKFVKDPKARVAAQAAAAIPLVEALVNKSGFGHALGTERIIMLPPPAAGAGSPAQLQYALEARLDARLEDEYPSEY